MATDQDYDNFTDHVSLWIHSYLLRHLGREATEAEYKAEVDIAMPSDDMDPRALCLSIKRRALHYEAYEVAQHIQNVLDEALA